MKAFLVKVEHLHDFGFHMPIQSQPKCRMIYKVVQISGATFSGRYDGSQTTFLPLAVSPSEVTPKAFPSASNSTCNPKDWLSIILCEKL